MKNWKKILQKLLKDKRLIVLGLIIVILTVILIIIGTKGKNNLNTVRIENQSMYQYLDNVKVTYDTSLTLESDNNITNMEISDKKEHIDNLPLYYNGLDMAIFPSNMSLIFPLNNYTQKRFTLLKDFLTNEDMLLV